MKKIKLLSLVLAMVMCVTLTLSACNNSTLGEHDHIWDNGEVTTEPTCHSEGVRTYSCTVKGCKQTKTSPVGMTEHSWDKGEVTTEPKCDDAGETTYKCTNEGCTAIKKEPIGKTDHRWDDGVITKTSEFTSAGVRTYTCLDCKITREVSVDAHADYVEQFYTEQSKKTDWSYGAATTFDVTSGNIVFAEATVENSVWKATGVEIGSGAVKLTSAKAAIRYTFTEELPKLVRAMFDVSFKGGVVRAYLVVVGEQTSVVTLNEDKAEWTYSIKDVKEALDVAKGDNVYLILDAGTSTVEGTLSFTIYAPCLHVWDQGTVTKAPKCNEKGEKTFKCASCEEEYKQPIDEIPHEWDDGEVTKAPTASSEGVKTFTCKNCSEKRTESIPKLEYSGTLIGNFGDVFADTLAGNSNWEVGKVDFHWKDTETAKAETFDFTALTADAEAFKNGEPWMEVKGDWMANNDMVGLAYHFKEKASINFNFALNCDVANRFSVRWALKDSAGNIKTIDGKASWGGVGNNVTVTGELEVVVGDVLYLLVQKEGDSAGDQCNFSLVLIAKEQEKPFVEVNFDDDFKSTLAGESNWEVGIIDFHWQDTETAKAETFDFTALIADTEAFKNGEPWMEIKGGWMANKGMVGFAYHFETAATVNFNFAINCLFDGKCSIRWGLKGSDGVIKTNDGKVSWGGDGANVTVNQNITVANGDTLYILVNYEEGSDQSEFSFVISPVEQVSFGNDFDATLAGESNWEVGMVGYHWNDTETEKAETFDYTKLTKLSSDNDAFQNDEPWMQIKGDWMAVNAMVGLAYNVQGAASVNFNFELHTEGNFSVRWALKDKDGNIKTNDGKASWGGAGKDITVTNDITVEEGDVLYILIQKEGDSSTDQCNFNLSLLLK